MTTPSHSIAQASLAAVQLEATYPAAALYPSGSAFPGQSYTTVGLGGAVLSSEVLGWAVLSTTAAGGAVLTPISTSVLVSA